MEEPYGTFGHMNPTGHAAIYLNHVCAASPTELRECKAGEPGVVISRYYRVAGYDWFAIPLIPYLYAVDRSAQMPETATVETRDHLRDAYRRRYLRGYAPDGPNGSMPEGDWTQLVGASYDRKIYGLSLLTTAEQDRAFIAMCNDRSNDSHFNLIYRNCANFSGTVIGFYFPGAVHRSFIFDAGVMTPQQVARSVVKYGKKHPELELTPFVIPQVPGTIERSRAVHGVAESLVKSKKYVVPLALLVPEFTGGLAVSWFAVDRFAFPKDAEVLSGAELVKAETTGDNGLTAPFPDRTVKAGSALESSGSPGQLAPVVAR
ncbi:MAG TPA: hypothetical protein VGB94_13135 [Acidobacteriaceae bacterium]